MIFQGENESLVTDGKMTTILFHASQSHLSVISLFCSLELQLSIQGSRVNGTELSSTDEGTRGKLLPYPHHASFCTVPSPETALHPALYLKALVQIAASFMALSLITFAKATSPPYAELGNVSLMNLCNALFTGFLFSFSLPKIKQTKKQYSLGVRPYTNDFTSLFLGF